MEVPDANLLGLFRPREAPPGEPTEALVRRALETPIDSPRLSSLAGAGQKVLLLSDDFTRPTPVADMLPPVLAELQAGGVRKADIKILIASGTHRPMTDEERARKLGPEVSREYEVFQQRWQDEQELVRLGETSAGLPIVVNRRLAEADLVVGLGHIVPHRITGYSGGAKIVGTGTAGAPPGLHEIHWLGAQVPGRELLGVADNPVRRNVNEIGRRTGLRFVVNVVQDTGGKVTSVFAGDPVGAHRRGCDASRDIYGVELPSLADIVIADSYPADADFWQAAKAVYATELAVRPGGVTTVVTPCPEGVSREHPALLRYGVRPVAEIRQLVESGEIKDVIGAAIMALTAWVVKERATGIMVSPGIPAGDQLKLGFTPAGAPQEALDRAFALVGRDARVAVLLHGGEILPLAPGEAERRIGAVEAQRAGA